MTESLPSRIGVSISGPHRQTGRYDQEGTVVDVFEGRSYAAFLGGLAQRYPRQEVFLIHDNAAYHRAPEVREWLADCGHRFHLCPLPKYSPEFNAVEPLWHYVRVQATHNRYYATEREFVTQLDHALNGMAQEPTRIQGYLNPFLKSSCLSIYARQYISSNSSPQ